MVRVLGSERTNFRVYVVAENGQQHFPLFLDQQARLCDFLSRRQPLVGEWEFGNRAAILSPRSPWVTCRFMVLRVKWSYWIGEPHVAPAVMWSRVGPRL